MGLSNEERQTKLYWSIHHLVDESRNLPTTGYEHEQYDRLRDLCDQMWFAFLGRATNGGHWFAGSSATNQIGGPDSPWAVALLNHFSHDRSQGKSWRDKHRDRLQKEYDEQYEKDPDLADLPDDDHINRALGIDRMLGCVSDDGPAYKAVYLIYAGTEGILYALRRYDDAFLARYPVLNKLVSDIQGECFGIFARHEAFARAYLLNQILDLMYAHDNPVRALAVHQHWHHTIANPMRKADLKTLRKWHLAVTKNPVGVTPTDWVALALEMMGSSYEYEHQFKDVIRIAKKRGFPLDEARLRPVFDACIKARKAEAAKSSKQYREDSSYSHMSAIHGHDEAYKQSKKRPKKPKTEEPKTP
jgi:hypothetical protein